jgi:hypothetical protein
MFGPASRITITNNFGLRVQPMHRNTMNSAALLIVYLHFKIIGHNGHAIIIDAKNQFDIAWHNIGSFNRTNWGTNCQEHCHN